MQYYPLNFFYSVRISYRFTYKDKICQKAMMSQKTVYSLHNQYNNHQMEGYKVEPDSWMSDSLKSFNKHMPLIDNSQLCEHHKCSPKIVEVVARDKKAVSYLSLSKISILF